MSNIPPSPNADGRSPRPGEGAQGYGGPSDTTAPEGMYPPPVDTASPKTPTAPPSVAPPGAPPGTPEGEATLPAQEGTSPNSNAPTAVPPTDAAVEPTVGEGSSSPFQTEFQPGEPYPNTLPPGVPVAPPGTDPHGAYPHEQWPTGAYTGHDGGYEPPGAPGDADPNGYYPQPSNRTNPILVLISGVLVAAVLAGGGYIWFLQNQAAKTAQQQALDAAQSEAKIAREEAKKAKDEALKAREEAKQQAEEARKAAEAAAKTPTPPPSPTPAAPAPENPAPTKPAQPKPAPAKPEPGKNRGKPIGSGCTPGGSTLPNGTWYAYAWGVDTDTVSFDLVCVYGDGSVTNDSKKVRTMHSDAGWDPGGSLVGMDVSGGVIIAMWEM